MKFLLVSLSSDRPYLIVSVAFAAVSVFYLTAKAVMLHHHLVSKWGVLLLACGLFSVAHVFVAMNVNFFARRRKRMGLLGQVICLLLQITDQDPL